MPPEVLKFLYDIQQACELIAQFTAGSSADDFRNDAKLRSAVERQFIIIGEALQQALRVMPELANSISDCRRIINFRNVMVHGYAQIVPDTVWGVIETGLQSLAVDVRRLIDDGADVHSD